MWENTTKFSRTNNKNIVPGCILVCLFSVVVVVAMVGEHREEEWEGNIMWVSRTGIASNWCTLQEALYK